MAKSRKSAENEAYERIKKALIMKRLLPGQQLTEEWIALNLNMSRTPIRSALKLLEREGLINIIPNRGAFVANPKKKEIQDVYNVRIVLECYAIEQAISSITHKDIQEMELLLKQEKQAYKDKDFEKFIQVNDQIHIFPAIITGNQYLINQVSSLITFGNCFLILKDTFYSKPIEDVRSIPEHKQIVEALKVRDKILARNAVKKHLESTVETFINNKTQSIL